MTIKIGDRVRFISNPQQGMSDQNRFENGTLGTVTHITPPFGAAKGLAHVNWDDAHRKDLDARDFPGYYLHRFVVIDFEEENPRIREILDDLIAGYEHKSRNAQQRADSEQRNIDNCIRIRDEALAEVKAYNLAIEKLEKK